MPHGGGGGHFGGGGGGHFGGGGGHWGGAGHWGGHRGGYARNGYGWSGVSTWDYPYPLYTDYYTVPFYQYQQPVVVPVVTQPVQTYFGSCDCAEGRPRLSANNCTNGVPICLEGERNNCICYNPATGESGCFNTPGAPCS